MPEREANISKCTPAKNTGTKILLSMHYYRHISPKKSPFLHGLGYYREELGGFALLISLFLYISYSFISLFPHTFVSFLFFLSSRFPYLF